MPSLKLHVGHDKTGSSFLQSCFVKSLDVLEASLILYPTKAGIRRAQDGSISTGNGKLLNRSSLEKLIAPLEKDLFYSSEKLFKCFFDGEFQNLLECYREKFQLDTIQVLLFIRDPCDHFRAAYQQTIKRGGSTKSLSEFAKVYDRPKKVAEFLHSLIEVNGYSIHVLNYTKHRDTLAARVESWLGLRQPLRQPEVQVVNRSLTTVELEFQRCLNRFGGRSASVFADRMCNEFPDVYVDPLLVNDEIFATVVENNRLACMRVNSVLESLGQVAECYDLTWPPPQFSETRTSLTSEQIQAIVEACFNIAGALK